MSRLPHSIVIVALTMAVAGVTCPAWAGEIAEDNVLLNVEMEGWGAVKGMQPVAYEEASRGIAMSMSADALAVGALDLQPGDYTLLLSQMAPACSGRSGAGAHSPIASASPRPAP